MKCSRLPAGKPDRQPLVVTQMTIPMFKNLPCIKIDGESAKAGTHEVIDEVPEALFVNGRHAMTAMMSPTDLEDFVTGYLFTEQIIKGADEIESIRIEKNRISVITKNLFKVLGPKKTILSGCGGATSYIDTEKLPKITSDLSLSPELIRTMVRDVLESDLHKMTGGIHVVGLASAKGIITRSEDIGRHNALDRVIGYGLRNRIDFSQTFAICSGRISSEMVRKSLIANIPVVVSRGATTTLAVTIAEQNGVCVIGFVRSTKMNVYSHPERLQGAPSLPQ
ncbi:formate dehydrogenase accessory sulfurtransferase FdhD [Methanoregula sp.]|jgi:FdhD protein|uniref:formate dehydrogenase accessory sulfurtransferase FdhD n=1 Tax=Methanoregula sp. TaxID=2052170 RepID=UPI003454260D